MSLDIGLTIDVDTDNPEVTGVSIGESFNITHNVSPMWDKAAITRHLAPAKTTFPLVSHKVHKAWCRRHQPAGLIVRNPKC